MRYKIYLSENKGGYEVGEADTLEEALLEYHRQVQRHNERCIVYDKETQTTDIRKILRNEVNLKI